MHAFPRRLLIHAQIVTALALVLAASWAFVAWMTLDMSHPVVMMMMPTDAAWSWATVGAIFMMWAVMMIAMMLPSAAPIILTFDMIERRNSIPERLRLRSLYFMGAYLAVLGGARLVVNRPYQNLWTIVKVPWIIGKRKIH